ncbi:MAG: hypothetical protein HQ556_07650 [Candidatus Marinimicrobia bacterium]|nr:hypothetical protein [Candidatus Neomarinimicrobiota bacterium]
MKIFLYIAILLVLVISCHHSNSCDENPDPLDYEYTKIPFVLRLMSVNQEKDTLGLESLRVHITRLKFRRYPEYDSSNPRCEELRSDIYINFEDSIIYNITNTDSIPTEFNTTINHFKGYQSAFGGDTTTLNIIDSINVWYSEFNSIFLDREHILEPQDTLIFLGATFGFENDTISRSNSIEILIQFNLDDMIHFNNSNDGKRVCAINRENVTVTQH